MVRWIAFDDDTADALVGKFKRGAAEIREGDVLDSSLHHDEANILIYPSPSPERVLLARVDVITSPKSAAEPINHSQSSRFARQASPLPPKILVAPTHRITTPILSMRNPRSAGLPRCR